MKIRLDQRDGIATGKAIEIEARNHSPKGHVSVTICNGEQQASVELNAERARQVAMALITAVGGGGDAG